MSKVLYVSCMYRSLFYNHTYCRGLIKAFLSSLIGFDLISAIYLSYVIYQDILSIMDLSWGSLNKVEVSGFNLVPRVYKLYIINIMLYQLNIYVILLVIWVYVFVHLGNDEDIKKSKSSTFITEAGVSFFEPRGPHEKKHVLL